MRGREAEAAMTDTVTAKKEAEVSAEKKGKESGKTAETEVTAKKEVEEMVEQAAVKARRIIQNVTAKNGAAVESLLAKEKTL